MEKAEGSEGRSKVLMLLNMSQDLSGPDKSLGNLEVMLFGW